MPNNDKPSTHLPEVKIPQVSWENEREIKNIFELRGSQIADRIEDVQPLTSSSGNSDVWKITFASKVECSRTNLKRFKDELQKTVGHFRCYDVFHDGRDKIHIYVYPTQEEKPTRRQERNRGRAAAHAVTARDRKKAPSNSKPTQTIQFVKGETLFQERAGKQNIQEDIVQPVTTRLTRMSLESTDQRYALSRFRDEHTFHLVRRYLAYNRHMREAVDTTGNTFLTATVALSSLGLPASDKLQDLYYKFCIECMNLDRDSVDRDLDSCRRYEQLVRTTRLQTLREKEHGYFK